MDIPGEKLLIKMWESLVDNGIGGLLTPWHTQRQARAQLENRRLEILLLAQTEREAEDIRAGRKSAILLNRNAVKLLANTNLSDLDSERVEPTLGIETIAKTALESQYLLSVREETNVARTVLQAEDILRDESSLPPPQAIDTDWLFRWRENAAAVSSSELQSLWARVLAGEVKRPGNCSLRTMDFLRNITKAEAEEIQLLCPYLINGEYILTYGSMAKMHERGIAYEMRMQELGILSGVEASLSISFKPKTKATTGQFITFLRSKGRNIEVFATEQSSDLTLDLYRVTALGIQILSLNPLSAPEEYLKAIALAVENQGFRTNIVEVVETSGHLQM